MIALWIILAIIALIVILFSIKFTVSLTYNEQFNVDVKWLFIKKQILPGSDEEKEEKPKKEKKEKPKKEKPEEDNKQEKQKKDNILVSFYKNQGFSGVMQLLRDTVSAINGMFGSIFRHFVFHELKLYLTVGAGDSAETAILYGKTCSYVFPAMGLITSTCKVKDYCCDIQPNFMQADKTAVFRVVMSFRPIFITNAVIVLAFKLLFKVVFKLLKNKNSVPVQNKTSVKTTKNPNSIEKNEENNLKEENKS
ncbi:MAG: DUF2953 domain-containing protein [Clostridia bacterium]|nr:DUF2953 domain-containing protein [Clostridia bacterium]